MVKQLNNTNLNPIYLNAGDNFQGTIWYNTGRWNVTNQFLNILPADAQTIGNHDFDHGIEGVVPFLRNQITPTLLANIDDTDEPTIQGEYKKSMIIERSGEKIGIIGVILRTTNTIAKTGNLKFLNEAQSVKAEAEVLKTQGVNKIIVISHCGLDRDREIARDGGPDIDVIVGGHSHSLLFNGNPPLDNPAASYPVLVVQEETNHTVLIVQASAYTKYVGNITLWFDGNGIVQNWEGNPVFLGNKVQQDTDVVRALTPWKEIIDQFAQRVVGKVYFDVSSSGCYQSDCLMGSLQADSMAFSAFDEEYENDEWTWATIAITNAGGVRGTLVTGELTYSNLITTTPFENTCDRLEIQGKYLKEAFERPVAFESLSIFQASGIRVVYNMTKPSWERVQSLKVLCTKCEVPRYEEIEDETWYRAVINNFMLFSGNTLAIIRDNMRSHRVGLTDIEALTAYVEKNSPVTLLQPRGRVKFLN
jgi:5'-nucleotidase